MLGKVKYLFKADRIFFVKCRFSDRKRIQKKSRSLLSNLSSQLPAHNPEILNEFCEVILSSGQLGTVDVDTPDTPDTPVRDSYFAERDHENQSNQSFEKFELREDVLKSHARLNMDNRDFKGIQLSQIAQLNANRSEDSGQSEHFLINFSRAVTASSILVESDMNSPTRNTSPDRTEFEKEEFASEGSIKSGGRRRASSFQAEVLEGLIHTGHESLKRTAFSINQKRQLGINFSCI